MKLSSLAPLIQYCKTAFSDKGSPSSSRLMTVIHSFASIGCLVYMVIKTGGHPDAMAVTALGGFATVHYAVNRATTAWGKDNTPKPDVISPVPVSTLASGFGPKLP